LIATRQACCRRPASALIFTRRPNQLWVSLMPASALDFYRCQHPRWTFIGASIRAGLVLLPASALDFCYCQQPRWTFVISVDIVVDGQHLCWTCAFFFVDIDGLAPPAGLGLSF
jgi:hypothetical protein